MANASDRPASRGEAALTIIAPGTKVVGEIETSGVVKVEGVVSGTVRAERQVLVARGGVVEGDIHATEAVVGGRVEGAVHAVDRVEVQTGASVKGDVSTRSLIVQEGGEVNGLINMTPSTASSDQAEKRG
jgi:cytoskeletal protein CcmA (bactofilin family)